MCQLFVMKNPYMKIERTDGMTPGQAQSNMLLQVFQSWGHNNMVLNNLTKFHKVPIKTFQLRERTSIQMENFREKKRP